MKTTTDSISRRSSPGARLNIELTKALGTNEGTEAGKARDRKLSLPPELQTGFARTGARPSMRMVSQSLEASNATKNAARVPGLASGRTSVTAGSNSSNQGLSAATARLVPAGATLFETIGLGIQTVLKAIGGFFASLFGGRVHGDAVTGTDPSVLPGFALETVNQARDLPGYSELSPAEQLRLDAVLGGGTNPISKITRARFKSELIDKVGAGITAAAQATWLRTLLNPLSSRDVTATSDQPDLPDPAHVGRIANYVFIGSTQAANQYMLEAYGRQIPIIIPEALPGHTTPTPEQIRDAIAYMRPDDIAQINRIVVSPVATSIFAPDGAYMSALPNGEVTIYPDHNYNPRRMATSMTHEVGHVISTRPWGGILVGPGWNAWRRAIDNDATTPSSYATTNMREDFSEAYRLYSLSFGTPAHAELRAMLPHRFALIDSMVTYDDAQTLYS